MELKPPRRPSDDAVLLTGVIVAVLVVALGAALIYLPAGLLAGGGLTLTLSLAGLRSGRP